MGGALLGCFLFWLSQVAWADGERSRFDHSTWDAFLKKFVNEKGEVNYRAIEKDRALLDAYLGQLKLIPAREFPGWQREERMAIFINAYNAGVIKLILDYYPIKSVMDIPGFWDESALEIGISPKRSGEPADETDETDETEREKEEAGAGRNFYSLNILENSILRVRFGDEKMLFSLSKGARGSPRLREEAYTGSRVDGQLYLAAREFVNDETRNRIRPGEKKIVLSRIFKWYRNDFLLNWGDLPAEVRWKPGEFAALSFIAHCLEDPKKVEFLQEGEYQVKYETFDWRLNDWNPDRKGEEA